MKKSYLLTVLLILFSASFMNAQLLTEVSRINLATGEKPAGIAWDGTNFWIASQLGDHIIKVDPATGNTLLDFPTRGGSTYGLVVLGGDLYYCDSSLDSLFQYTTAGVYVAGWDISDGRGASPRDLEVINGDLWYLDSDDDVRQMFKFDLTTGTRTDSIPVSGSSPRGFGFDGTYIWQTAKSSQQIFKIDFASKTVVDSLLTTDVGIETPYGGEFDGTLIWFGDYSNALIIGFSTGAVSVEKTDVIPTKFSLTQNYPNPFNPSTIISFAIPTRDNVKLTIYDALGRDLATLVNEELERGTYKYTWNAKGYSSGVYYYQIQTSKNIVTKKMMLVK